MEKSHVKDRLGQHGNANLSHVASEEAPAGQGEAEDPEKAKEDKAQAILAIQMNQEQLQTKHDLIKKAEEQRKSAMVQQEGLLKSKHVRFRIVQLVYVGFTLSILFLKDLLDGLIEQQKALIVKLEKGKGSIKPEEKAKIMKLLKELSSSIDRTKEDIKTSLNVSGLKNRTKLEVRVLML